MIYHALFVINQVSYGLLVETQRRDPHPEVLRHAELAAEFTDYSKLHVFKDRGKFFAPQHPGGPYQESELVKWVQCGAGVFDWVKVINRTEIKLPAGVPSL